MLFSAVGSHLGIYLQKKKKDFKSGFYFMSSAKLMKQTDTKHILAVQLYLV